MKRFVIVTLSLLYFVSFSALMGKEKGREILLKNNWYIQNSEIALSSGDKISAPSFKYDGWIKTTVPTTVMNSLVKNGTYKDLFFSTNLDKVPKEQFGKPWWFRTEFNLPKENNKKYGFICRNF